MSPSALSVAYRAGVVVIESDDQAPSEPLPVAGAGWGGTSA